MLELEARQLLLESLRPPAGFSLDRAVGTTFSLDLHALLMAPLAFALFDTDAGSGQPDPIALLESARRHAERIDIFCQAGQIALPPGQYERVLAYLEGSVHQVVPDTPRRVFHPKVWVLRFVNAEGGFCYRALCLSRNLTFAHSWDTILLLEGEVGGERDPNAEPLADFVRALPALVPPAMPEERSAAILELASQLEGVAFAPPPPFLDLAFLPLGIEGHRYRGLPLRGGELRLLISPFLSDNVLTGVSGGGGLTLVSRAEALDTLRPERLAAFDPYTLSADALGSVEDDAEIAEAASEVTAERAGCSLRGLHAKLYLAERGGEAVLWTGSANATAAAFGGNVEFLVELRGRSSQCGVAAMLGEDGRTFKALLDPYIRGDEPPAEASAQEQLEERLDTLRHALAAARFVATVAPGAEGDVFHLQLAAEANEPWPPEAEARVWPISLAEARARPLREALEAAADFGAISFDRLTSFFAIELVLVEGGLSARTRFVVNSELEGAPENRGDLLLSRLLESRDKVLRYLLLLLSSDGFTADGSGPVARLLEALDGSNRWHEPAAVPLLESMIRTLARDPRRLDDVTRLVESLRKTEEGRALLPEGFDEVWEPVAAARAGGA